MASHLVLAGQDLQKAINSAQTGDVIKLAPGASWQGDFILPYKPQGGVLIETDTELLSLGNRLTEELIPKLATIRGCFNASPKAYGYTLSGLKIKSYDNHYTTGLVQLGPDLVKTVEDLPHHFKLMHCLLEGDAKKGGKRGVYLNCKSATIQDSIIRGIWSDFQDSQAICGINGPGPFHILNNYLEGSGENIMFGGAAPTINGLIPSDINIIHNHIAKPKSWINNPLGMKIKNLFELKNAQRVKLVFNILEGNWTSAQAGFGIQLTPRTCEAGDYSWAVVKDVTIENNILDSEHGINISGADGAREACKGGIAGLAENIIIRNNLIKRASWVFQLLSGPQNITIENNSALDNKEAMIAIDSHYKQIQKFTFRNNIIKMGNKGIVGSAVESGTGTLKAFCPGYICEGNIIFAAPVPWMRDTRWYPANNRYPEIYNQSEMDFATTNKVGCDALKLEEALKNVRSGKTVDESTGKPIPVPASVKLVVTETLSPGEYILKFGQE